MLYNFWHCILCWERLDSGFPIRSAERESWWHPAACLAGKARLSPEVISLHTTCPPGHWCISSISLPTVYKQETMWSTSLCKLKRSQEAYFLDLNQTESCEIGPHDGIAACSANETRPVCVSWYSDDERSWDCRNWQQSTISNFLVGDNQHSTVHSEVASCNNLVDTKARTDKTLDSPDEFIHQHFRTLFAPRFSHNMPLADNIPKFIFDSLSSLKKI